VIRFCAIRIEFLQRRQPLPEDLCYAFFQETTTRYTSELRSGGYDPIELYHRPLGMIFKEGNTIQAAANYYRTLLAALVSVRQNDTRTSVVLRAEVAVELAKVMVFILKKHT
jgi:hypothetical protein